MLLGLGDSTIDSIAAAITRMEGSCPSPSNCRSFNPGNLRAGPGQIGVDSRGIAIFPDYATGYAALTRQITLNITRYPDLTLYTFFAGQRDDSGNVVPGGYPGYAPAADSNQPLTYAQNVATWTGIDPNAPLSQVISGAYAPPIDTTGDTPDSSGSGDGATPPDAGFATMDTTTMLALAGLGLVVLALAT